MSYPKRGLSVDIGNEKIKIVEYQRSKEKIKVTHTVLIDTPDNVINDGVIVGMESLVEVMNAAISEAKFKTKNVIYTIASSKIITREVDLPDLPLKKLDTLIKMNADEYFPVNLAEYTLDHRIIDHVNLGEGNQAKVNIIAALTTLLEGYVELSGFLGLKIVGIDYSGNSMVNYGARLGLDETFMILDLGSDSTMVSIMTKDISKFSRNLVYGTKVINSSIQNHFGVESKEATRISIEQVLLSHEPEANDYLSNDVSTALNQILNGVSRLVDYYSSRNKDSIDKIYLVGGGTNIKGIAAYVEHYFNISCEVISEHPMLSSTNEQYNTKQQFFSNAVGAIYSEMNLLPMAIRNKDKIKAANRLKIEIGLLALLLTAVAIYVPYLGLRSLQNDKKELEAEIAEKQVVEGVLAEYNSAMGTLVFNESIITMSGSTTEIMVEILEKMEQEIPSNVDYLTMNNSEEGLLISCIATDKLTIVNFLSTLKALTIDDKLVFQTVHVPSISEVEGDSEDAAYYAFSIACEYIKEVQ